MKNLIRTCLLAGFLFFSLSTAHAQYGQEGFIGEVRMFAGDFAPKTWAFCEGQLLPIVQHQALFSILGTMYGGNGKTTFALPNLKGRTPVHASEMNPQGSAGGGTPVARAQGEEQGTTRTVPYQEIRYIICLQGLFPSRN